MAITERYVTSGAGGGGAGTSGSPWTFAEAVTNAVAGDRINIQSDAAYSIGATTFPATGTFDSPVIWRGYNATIGDCDNLGRNANGTLVTTGMPEITVTGIWVPANYVTFQSLNITAALSNAIVLNTNADWTTFVSCRLENTLNDSVARCVVIDDSGVLINSDFICSGAASDYILSADINLKIIGCRFEITASDNCIELHAGCTILDSVFVKNGSLGGTGINLDTVSSAVTQIAHCTFYNFTNAILSTVTHTGGFFILSENHCTDCTQYINNTTEITVYDIRTRTRDITSPPATVELIQIGPITTDTGGIATDYVDAGAGDLNLITAAPGYNAGWNGGDVGGLQTVPSGGGGGGPLIGGRLVR